jgi:zinc protease
VERLRREIDEEIARIARDGPTPEEMQRARNRIESQVIFALEPVGGFGGRASHLNSYYFETGDPGFLAKDLARYRSVTADEVRDAARRWVAHDRRVVLTVVPRPAPAPAPAEGGR